MRARYFAILMACFSLPACGAVVPEIQENRAAPGDAYTMVQAITQSVKCELATALRDVWTDPYLHAQHTIDFLSQWGVQITLTLTIDEKSSIGPNLVWMPPSPAAAIFGLGLGGAASADATRKDTLSFYYLVPTLLTMSPCKGGPQGNDNSLLVQSDLKIEEWLRTYISPVGTSVINAPTSNSGVLKDNALSHDIKFDVVTSGNLTPGWKLTRVTVNNSPPFLSASRDRTHDLSIIMGPGDKTGLTGNAALTAYEAQQIDSAIATGFRSALTP